MSLPDYNLAFHDGAVAEEHAQGQTGAHAARRYTLHLHAPGELVVTSGHIVTCDPLVMPGTPPLADTVPPGHYPVILSVAESSGGDQRVAYALLRLSEQPAVRWEMAIPQGQSLDSLEPGYFFGYPVDAGIGCFMDADAARALVALMAQTTEDRDAMDVGEEILTLMDKTYVDTWSWVDLVTDNANGANVIAFSSGWGDGFYPCYWGYDATDQRVALVTDFRVLDESWLAR